VAGRTTCPNKDKAGSIECESGSAVINSKVNARSLLPLAATVDSMLREDTGRRHVDSGS
jgi:hypothetical protein